MKIRSVDTRKYSMVVRPDVPRSVFASGATLKTTFNSDWLVPIYVDEVLPGDSHRVNLTAFARLATPFFPVMDNLYLDTFFFFVPYRLIWEHANAFFGEQNNPADTTAFLIPVVTSPVGGFAVSSVYDYMGIPVVGQIGGAATINVNALPLRAYLLIYNQWFRDEDVNNSVGMPFSDGPDLATAYPMQNRNKRPDYFTSCRPWPAKPGPWLQSFTSVGGVGPHFTEPFHFGLQLGAPVSGIGMDAAGVANTVNQQVHETGGGSAGSIVTYPSSTVTTAAGDIFVKAGLSAGVPDVRVTINNLRLAYHVQRLLETNARGGTRYTELIRAHFGVISPDMRQQRAEYLGGGSTPININPIAQTSATGLTGGSTPLGGLAGIGTGVVQNHGFSSSFTEHGVILGLANVRADLTYQEGLHRMWFRRSYLDFYWPAFAQLGEQPVYSKEIYCDGTAGDDTVFGYQERWAEYRYRPSLITGKFRSKTAGTLHAWHLAQSFAARPTLSSTFLATGVSTVLEARILAAGAGALNAEVLFDAYFDVRMVRPIPARSVPGLGVRL